MRVYPSDFGIIHIHENVPDELVPVYPCAELDAILEKMYVAGGNVGNMRAHIEVHDDVDDVGRRIGTIYYLHVPFEGYFLHKLKRTNEIRTARLTA